jgi:hypothetical protein
MYQNARRSSFLVFSIFFLFCNASTLFAVVGLNLFFIFLLLLLFLFGKYHTCRLIVVLVTHLPDRVWSDLVHYICDSGTVFSCIFVLETKK